MCVCVEIYICIYVLHISVLGAKVGIVCILGALGLELRLHIVVRSSERGTVDGRTPAWPDIPKPYVVWLYGIYQLMQDLHHQQCVVLGVVIRSLA